MGKNRIGKSVLCLILVIAMLCSLFTVYASENEGISAGQTDTVSLTEGQTGGGAETVAGTETAAINEEGDSNKDGEAALTAEETDSENAGLLSDMDASDTQEGELPIEEPKNPGWEAHEDGTWSYYDQNGKAVTGWILWGTDWYYVKPETNRTAKSETLKIGNELYHFRPDGIMVANGWVFVDGAWYLAAASGALLTGWQLDGGLWYYMDRETGEMLTGFADIGEETYLLNSSGAMLTGWQFTDGQWYYFRADGAMVKSGWLFWYGSWYYLQEDGRMAGDGWLTTTEGRNYYMTAGGRMTYGWQLIDGNWYYLGANDSDGELKTGWCWIGDKWYYLRPDTGAMTYGWQLVDEKWYYLSDSINDGAMQTGWKYLGNEWYYLGSDGAAKVGFHTIDGLIYFFDENCMMLSDGLLEVDGQYYLLTESGAAWTGWILDDEGDWYYFDKTTGAMCTGWQKIDNVTYYMGLPDDGAAKTGWQEIDGNRYYFGMDSCALYTGWLKLDGSWYYLDPAAEGAMAVGWLQIGENWYYFYEDGVMAADAVVEDKYYFNSNGVWEKDVSISNIFNGIAGGQKTIKNLLQNAMKPVGSTLYIWGGGHDTGADGDATRYGVNPEWAEFYQTQDAGYNYDNYRWKYGKGLDCSGFVGWAAYNTMYTESNQSWTVTTSYMTAKTYANKGWGTLLDSPETFKPGDVVSMSGHTYIVLGQCSDGSLVIVHSTPPALQISGTCTPDGDWSSEAIALAQYYMNKYYPTWYFTSQSCGTNYFTDVTVNRWLVDGTGILTDPQGYQNMSAEEVLKDLFGA